MSGKRPSDTYIALIVTVFALFIEEDNLLITLYHGVFFPRPGTTIPSDRKPSIFWVTSPLNKLIENHAAGSTHMGIWYIFGENVTGPSADLGLFQHMEAFKTAILKNEDNVVHSCGETGFMFGGALQHDQDFSEHTALCDPRITPLDPNSPPAVNHITRMTVFKNVKENIWNDCRATKWANLHSSDAYLGLTMAHNNWVIDSTFIGESSNWGEPNRVLLRNGSKVMWHRWKKQIAKNMILLIFFSGPRLIL